MKTLLSLAAVAVSAGVLSAASPQVIQKGKAPIVVLPRYLPSASEAKSPDSEVALEKFQVTGSMLPKPEAKKFVRMSLVKH